MSNSQIGLEAGFDPRSVCNLILDEADHIGRSITNLALQKLLYFAHGLHLVEARKPLVTGFFEAWRFGPVHPTAYHAFKSEGANALRIRATTQDPFTRISRPIPKCVDPAAISRVRRIVNTYGAMTPGWLVEVSHAENAPWAYTVHKARTQTVLGLRIPDDVIRDRFRFHKVSIGEEPKHGEPREEVPIM